jgi:hypothetical protein
VEAWVYTWDSLYGISGGQHGIGTGFSLSYSSANIISLGLYTHM